MWRKQGRGLLRPHELAVLDAVRAALAPEARGLLDRQIAAVQRVERSYDESDVELYPNRGGGELHDPAIALPNRAKQLRLATVELHGPAGTGRAVVNAVGGQLFEVLYRPSLAKLGDRSGIQTSTVTIHLDPMLPDDGASAEERLGQLEPSIRAELEERWKAGTSGVAGLLDREEVYTIDLDEGTYLVLARLADSMILARVDPPDSGVRRYANTGELAGEYPTLASALITGS